MALPTLRTERLVLHPFTVDDVDRLHQLWTDPDVRRYLWDDIVIPRERADETVRGAIVSGEQHGIGMWTIVDAHSFDLVGFCGFIRREDEEHPELLYGLAPGAWGRGFATEAARAAIAYAFDVLGCVRVLAATDPPNTASVRVMERLGLRFVRRGELNGLDTLFYEIERTAFATASRTARR